ncbi:MAG: hypothetical protein F6K22_39925, partial [Okeania sp. SIO2F4]|uniref:hypothetical protein n=1 Tax=Okeania sp. SIO2F4 TaxID=2607790 RepID=UPI00142C4B1F
YVFNKEFTNDYYAEVSIDTYDGTVFYDFFGTNNPTEEPKFIVVIPYPPRPQLTEFTVTEDELRAWAQDYKSYIPRNFNPYIPNTGSSC